MTENRSVTDVFRNTEQVGFQVSAFCFVLNMVLLSEPCGSQINRDYIQILAMCGSALL